MDSPLFADGDATLSATSRRLQNTEKLIFGPDRMLIQVWSNKYIGFMIVFSCLHDIICREY